MCASRQFVVSRNAKMRRDFSQVLTSSFAPARVSCVFLHAPRASNLTQQLLQAILAKWRILKFYWYRSPARLDGNAESIVPEKSATNLRRKWIVYELSANYSIKSVGTLSTLKSSWKIPSPANAPFLRIIVAENSRVSCPRLWIALLSLSVLSVRKFYFYS